MPVPVASGAAVRASDPSVAVGGMDEYNRRRFTSPYILRANSADLSRATVRKSIRRSRLPQEALPLARARARDHVVKLVRRVSPARHRNTLRVTPCPKRHINSSHRSSNLAGSGRSAGRAATRVTRPVETFCGLPPLLRLPHCRCQPHCGNPEMRGRATGLPSRGRGNRGSRPFGSAGYLDSGAKAAEMLEFRRR